MDKINVGRETKTETKKDRYFRKGINWDIDDEDYFDFVLKQDECEDEEDDDIKLPDIGSKTSLRYYFQKLEDFPTSVDDKLIKERTDEVTIMEEPQSESLRTTELYDFVETLGEISSRDFSRPVFAKLQDNVLDGLVGLTMLSNNIGVIPSDKIIIRADYANMIERVRLLSGGSAGYDPLFSGYVGFGLLTAAVYGDGNGGPTPKQILTALRELKNPYGTLIIIRNNFDERLNFGLAMERARNEGILVDMVSVGDDCWEKQDNRVGRRGLTGVLATIKVAGAMSEARKSMSEIFIMCRAMILTSLSIVTPTNSCVKFGTDIRGNGGRSIENVNPENLVKEIVHYMIDSKQYLSASIFPLNKFIVMVNSYHTDRLLLGSLAKELLFQLNGVNVCVERLYCNTFISGPRPGFCVTLVKDIEEELLRWFDLAVPSRAWPENSLKTPLLLKPTFVSDLIYTPQLGCGRPYIRGPRGTNTFIEYTPECIKTACNAVISSEVMLNRLDPEENYGSIVLSGARALLAEVSGNQLQYERPFHLMNKISTVMENSIVGATGTVYGLFFTGIAQSFLSYIDTVVLKFENWVSAIKKGVKTLSSMINKSGDSELLDVLQAFYRGLTTHKKNAYLLQLAEGVERAEATIIEISTKQNGAPGPAAQTVVIILRAIFETIKKLNTTEIEWKRDPRNMPCPLGIVELPDDKAAPYVAEDEEVIIIESVEEEDDDNDVGTSYFSDEYKDPDENIQDDSDDEEETVS